LYVAKIQPLRQAKPEKEGCRMRWLAVIFHVEPTTTWSLKHRDFVT
jgi:hypothetical protein